MVFCSTSLSGLRQLYVCLTLCCISLWFFNTFKSINQIRQITQRFKCLYASGSLVQKPNFQGTTESRANSAIYTI